MGFGFRFVHMISDHYVALDKQVNHTYTVPW